jgi:hypothetical protein
MQRVRDAVAGVPGFDKLRHADKLRFFAWSLHAEGKEHLKAADFTGCYDVVHLRAPANVHRALQALEEQGDLLKSSQGYKLSKPLRDQLDVKHGNRPLTVAVIDVLEKLPSSLSSPAYRAYLDEAVRCFGARAWRAAIIMAWNVAFDHLCDHVITKKLAEFKRAYPSLNKKKPTTIMRRSDLQELKESEVILVCRQAGITDGIQHKCLDRNLGIRNDAAHPSGAEFDQPRSEAFILDVVKTIVHGLQ